MPPQLQWLVSGSAACFYDAARLAEGDMPVLAGAAECLRGPLAELRHFEAAHGHGGRDFFDHLVPIAATIESNRALAESVLSKIAGRGRSDSEVTLLAGLIGDCERAYFAAFPKLMDELALRGGPLRELWEAHGPGLLAAVGRATDPHLIVEAATVALVQPFAGGGGRSYPANNLVVIEAVLANPIPDLPETVRLAWLLSTLNADLPEYAEALEPGTPPAQIAATVGLAVLPAVLDAAASLDLVHPSEELLLRAVDAWQTPAAGNPKLAQLLGQWWMFAKQARAPWKVALAAMQKMLLGKGAAGRG